MPFLNKAFQKCNFMIRLCTKESMSADIMQTHESQMSSWPKTSSYIVRFSSHVSIQVYAKVFLFIICRETNVATSCQPGINDICNV